MGDRNRAVISVIGRDQKGVVARISTYLASCNINIEDTEQRVMEGLFIMTMLVDLSDLDTTLDELVMGLRRIGEEISMEVTVRLAGGPPERKRVAVLVTKEPHCLEQLVRDRDAGLLNGELVVVLSNHSDLGPLALDLIGPVPQYPIESLGRRRHQVGMRDPRAIEPIAGFTVLVFLHLRQGDAVQVCRAAVNPAARFRAPA